MKRKSGPFNIAICPPPGISARAMELSRLLQGRGGLFTLNKRSRIPHVTLYMAELPLENVRRAASALKDFSSQTSPFEIEFLSYKENKNGYVDVRFRESPELLRLHKRVVDLINPLREGLIRNRDREKMGELSKSERRNLELYGSRRVGSRLDPHLTLTKLREDQGRVISGLPQHNFSFRVTRIGLFHLGPHGTCRRLIRGFCLS